MELYLYVSQSKYGSNCLKKGTEAISYGVELLTRRGLVN